MPLKPSHSPRNELDSMQSIRLALAFERLKQEKERTKLAFMKRWLLTLSTAIVLPFYLVVFWRVLENPIYTPALILSSSALAGVGTLWIRSAKEE